MTDAAHGSADVFNLLPCTADSPAAGPTLVRLLAMIMERIFAKRVPELLTSAPVRAKRDPLHPERFCRKCVFNLPPRRWSPLLAAL